jgi:hypothetical protein
MSGGLTVSTAWVDEEEAAVLRPLGRIVGRQDPEATHALTDDCQISDAAWSRDGKRLAIARTTQTADIVLFRGLKR